METTSTQSTRPSRKSSRANEGDNGPETKKTKVRKGTRSCWECRRRKMKCIFHSPADHMCVSCQRRGAKCVGQQFPEEISTSLDRSIQMGDRVVRLEALVEKLLQGPPDKTVPTSLYKAAKDGGKPNYGILTPASVNSASPKFTSLCGPSADDKTVQYEILNGDSGSGLQNTESASDHLAEAGKHEGLSKMLHQSLPTSEDIKVIARTRGKISARFFQMMTATYKDLTRARTKSLTDLLDIPGPNVHPVLIGRHMLWIATFLQHLHPHLHDETAGLSEPPRQMMKRLADTSISLVTTNDDLLCSVEGLECVMIESLYHTNGGNLRKGLIAIRRAIVIAQLMGFHRSGVQPEHCSLLDPETQANPSFQWYRILFTERHLCLMLGLPQSTLDHSMASAAVLANDSPMGRLERIHCTIASRILERNQSHPSPNDVTLTQELDVELQKAGEDLPRKWWLAPNLATVMDDPEALFWDMRRLFHQLFHYNLLNQLHLPYMLRSTATEGGNDYSRITCVNASREVLSRFMMFQSIDRIAFWCRTMHYFSMMAAMTLIIAHLDGHRRCAPGGVSFSQQQQRQGRQKWKTENLLTHQRPGDRAMVEQVQESMEEISRLNEDALGAQSAELLRRLLIIEAEGALAASGQAYRVSGQELHLPTVVEKQTGELEGDRSSAVCVYIPHFGTIKIGREGIISKGVPKAPPSTACNANRIQHREIPGARTIGTGGTSTQATVRPSGFDSRDEISTPVGTALSDMIIDRSDVLLAGTDTQIGDTLVQSAADGHSCNDKQCVFPNSSTLPEAYLEQHGYLSTAGVNEWALQGVDMAFFDSLMRELGDGINGGSEWLTWPNEPSHL